MSDPFVTTGVDGQAPRLELHEFKKNMYQFSLYIQALQIMQIEESGFYPVTESTPDSHFQIGGIHGVPFEEWTGDSSSDDLIPNVELGYCTHGDNLFPTWHRPYEALYEQTVVKHAKRIAKKYDSDAWTRAARDLRVPYWDWAHPDTIIPPSEWVDDDRIQIKVLKGYKWVDNPLLRYKFQTPLEYTAKDENGVEQHYKYEKTFRNANTMKIFKEKFNSKVADQFRESVFQLFNPEKTITWDTFSNHGPDDYYSDNSLESVHDHVHARIGAFMGDPAIAGFDPIFYNHHCNVDRLLALWQTQNENTWVSPGNSRDGTSTIPELAPIDATTGLTPFWKSKTEVYDSNAIRDHRKLGYDYADFLKKGIVRDDPESVKRGIRQVINDLYGKFDPNIRTYLPHDNHRVVQAVESKSSTPADAESAIDKLLLAFTAHVELEPEETQIFHPHTLEYFEWSARVRVKHYALNKSFGVHFYLDAPAGATSDEELFDSYVGSFYTFVNSKAGSCANCRGQADAIDEGYVWLNSMIAERSGVNSFRPDNLLPYLSSKLSWKVKKLDGEEVPLDQVPSLEVVLHHTPVTLEAGKTRPARGNIARYPIVSGGL